ncbi:MAG: hypothetical protein LBB84_02400, partial [Tannerellaceae bacterium]|jgi:hypothetical protein|nr:hypothetical protein [Tannerellaceae bacterium]
LGGNLLQQFNFDEGVKEAMNLLPPPNNRPPDSQDGYYGALFLLQTEGHPGMEVTPLQFYNYPAYMIDRIEVFPYKMIKGSDETVHQGMVVAHLKISPKKPSGKPLRPGLEIYKPEGYCLVKEFYVPPYHTEAAYNDTTPDVRGATIYWQPVLETDHTGRVTTSFYTADKLTDYVIVVEGISEDGILGYGLKTFKVSQPRRRKAFAGEVEPVL